MFNNKIKLGTNFHFKDHSPIDLTSGVVYKFQCGLWNEPCYGECVRHLLKIGAIGAENVKIGADTLFHHLP